MHVFLCNIFVPKISNVCIFAYVKSELWLREITQPCTKLCAQEKWFPGENLNSFPIEKVTNHYRYKAVNL